MFRSVLSALFVASQRVIIIEGIDTAMGISTKANGAKRLLSSLRQSTADAASSGLSASPNPICGTRTEAALQCECLQSKSP